MKNIMTNMQCAALAGSKEAQVDATSIYEQHRNAMLAENHITTDSSGAKEDTTNWRDRINDENWRADVNDRLNYQGPNSPASSGGGLSPGGNMYGMMNVQPPPPHLQQPPHVAPHNPQVMNHGVAQQQQWQQNSPVWNNIPTQQSMVPPYNEYMDPNALNGLPPNHLPENASPPPPMAMTARIPSLGQQSVRTTNTAANMLSMSLSTDSDDNGADKYAGVGVEDEDGSRAMKACYGNKSMQYGNSGPYASHQHHLMTQESEIGVKCRYNSGTHGRTGGGNNARQMNQYYDPMNNVQGRQDGNMHKQSYHNEGITQATYGNYGSNMPQQNAGMMYGQIMHQQQPPAAYGNHLPHDQHPMSQLPPQRRTFIA
jgi:hypothetical protein